MSVGFSRWHIGDENDIPYPVTYLDKILIFLQTRNIKVNSLKHIDPLAFEGLPELRHIYTVLHGLQQAPDLSALRGTLKSFRLSYCIRACESINRKPLENLKSLIVDKSNLRVVPRDVRQVAPSLEFLVLSSNMISNLSNIYNIPFPKLRTVLLNFNIISHLSHEFLQLPVLQIFIIKHKKLTHLADISSCVWGVGHIKSGSIAALDVASNPWHYNGSMEWMKTSICYRCSEGGIYYKRLMLAIELDQLFCYSPAEWQGMAVVPVDDLDVNEIETCGEFYNDLHTSTITMPHIVQSLSRYTISRRYLNTLRARRNRHHFVDGVQMHFFKWLLKFHISLFTKITWRYSRIVWDNDLALTSRQAIIWNNDGHFT